MAKPIPCVSNEVRTNELLQLLSLDPGTNVKFLGRTRMLDGLTSEPIWEIQRIATTAATDLQQSNWGINPITGRNDDLIWDNRSTYFGAPPSNWRDRFSISFDGVNDSLDSSLNTFQFARTTPFSVSFWAFCNSTAAAFCFMGNKQDSGASDGWRIGMHAGTGAIRFYLMESAVNSIQVETSTPQILVAGWRHYCITYTGSSTAAGVAIYINGVAVPQTIITNALTLAIVYNQTFRVGVGGNGNNPYPGYMDEIAIYDVALTPLQVSQLIVAGKPADLSTLASYPDLMSWWWCGDLDIFPFVFDRGIAPGGINLRMTNQTAADIVNFAP